MDDLISGIRVDDFILGIGVDDFFVLITSYDKTNCEELKHKERYWVMNEILVDVIII